MPTCICTTLNPLVRERGFHYLNVFSCTFVHLLLLFHSVIDNDDGDVAERLCAVDTGRGLPAARVAYQSRHTGGIPRHYVCSSRARLSNVRNGHVYVLRILNTLPG